MTRLPASAAEMSEHDLAYWLLNAHLVRTYREGRVVVGRIRRAERRKPSVDAYQSTLEKRGLS